ncbi:unnamed protein product [Hymenolepis diminuta]|uniref:Uncharacterized protein n=1 Tax=Hymenolepis diminuta TaxID=6216 RepID=A0A564YS49_HYMDI|nr:unnamed protein product [Hymenolepis diminuta]
MKQQEHYKSKLKEQKVVNMETENLDISSPQSSPESLVQQITEFHYEPEADRTFTNWFGRCKDVCQDYLSHIPAYCYGG